LLCQLLYEVCEDGRGVLNATTECAAGMWRMGVLPAVHGHLQPEVVTADGCMLMCAREVAKVLQAAVVAAVKLVACW
jgi:hypothetical protein